MVQQRQNTIVTLLKKNAYHETNVPWMQLYSCKKTKIKQKSVNVIISKKCFDKRIVSRFLKNGKGFH